MVIFRIAAKGHIQDNGDLALLHQIWWILGLQKLLTFILCNFIAIKTYVHLSIGFFFLYTPVLINQLQCMPHSTWAHIGIQRGTNGRRNTTKTWTYLATYNDMTDGYYFFKSSEHRENTSLFFWYQQQRKKKKKEQDVQLNSMLCCTHQLPFWL